MALKKALTTPYSMPWYTGNINVLSYRMCGRSLMMGHTPRHPSVLCSRNNYTDGNYCRKFRRHSKYVYRVHGKFNINYAEIC
jgi:hypothetical protein